MKPAGRFLEKNPETGLWSDVGERKAVEKTSQALRDGAAELRKQLSADLHDPDFLNAVFDMDSTTAEAAPKKKPKPVKVNPSYSRNDMLNSSPNESAHIYLFPFSYTVKNSQERPSAHEIESGHLFRC